MNPLDHLKHLNKISADREYRERSRTLILMRSQKPKRAPWQLVFSVLQSGSAIAAASLILVLFAGGFSLLKFIETSGGLDKETLKAEAEAIDIQIQIADLTYQEIPDSPQDIGKKNFTAVRKPAAKSTSTPRGTGEATSTPAMTIDEALGALSSM